MSTGTLAAAESATRAPRVTLVPRADRYAGALFELLNDWDVVRMLAQVPWPLGRGDVVNAMQKAHGIDGFVILSGAEPIGAASLKRVGTGEPPRVMPRLGYWIGQRHWGRGHGTEAVTALVDYAFRNDAGEIIGAGVFHDNHASLRVLEKLGFREAQRYMTMCVARGREVETADMQMTRARWLAGAGA